MIHGDMLRPVTANVTSGLGLDLPQGISFGALESIVPDIRADALEGVGAKSFLMSTHILDGVWVSAMTETRIALPLGRWIQRSNHQSLARRSNRLEFSLRI